MNRDLTKFTRMQCPHGHWLTWRGRWIHTFPGITEVMAQYGGCAPGAAYPRSYYKLEISPPMVRVG